MARHFSQKFVNGDFATAVAAAGTTQSDATSLPAQHCQVTTVVGDDGVVIKASNAEDTMWGTVVNATSTDGLLVYPPSGWAFNGQTANDPINLPAGKGLLYFSVGYQKLNAIY